MIRSADIQYLSHAILPENGLVGSYKTFASAGVGDAARVANHLPAIVDAPGGAFAEVSHHAVPPMESVAAEPVQKGVGPIAGEAGYLPELVDGGGPATTCARQHAQIGDLEC